MKQIVVVLLAVASILSSLLADAKENEAPLPIPPVVAKYEYQGKTLPVFDAYAAGVKIVSAPFYPPLLKREGVSGSATVLIVVSADGKVLQAGPASCTHSEFAASVVQAVRGWKYRSIVDQSGDEITYVVRQSVFFSLEGEPDAAKVPAGSLLIRVGK